MITLYLVDKGILKKHILYLSDYFERNRKLYYDNLMYVREDHNMNQWLKYFLNGIIETSKKGVETFNAILQLQRITEEKLKNTGSRGIDAIKIVQSMYSMPIIDANKAMGVIGKSINTTYKTIDLLEEMKVIEEITGAQRGKLYAFTEYIDLFK